MHPRPGWQWEDFPVAPSSYGQSCSADYTVDTTTREGIAALALTAAAQAGLDVDEGAGLMLQSATGVIEAATPEAETILGLTLDQILGRVVADRRWAAIAPDGTALRARDYPSSRALRSGTPVVGAVIGVHRPGRDAAGKHVWLVVDSVPIGPTDAPTRTITRFSMLTGPRATELQLAASERLYRFLIEHDPDIVAWQLSDSTFLWVSSAVHDVLGYDPEDMVGRPAFDYMHPDDLSAARAATDLDGGSPDAPRVMILRMRHRDGHYLWMEVAGQAVRDAAGKTSQMRTAWRDATARIKAEHERDAAVQLVRSTLESSPIGIAVCSADGSFTQVNRALCEMLGRDADDLLGKTLSRFTHPADDCGDFAAVLSGALVMQESECRYQRSDGSWIWGHCNMVLLRDDATSIPRGVLVQLQDITERRRATEQLAHAATHDWLTGLANRQAFTERLTLAADQVAFPGPSAMIFVDVDDFKAVNDTYGHEIGDRLLREVAARVSAAIRPQDFAARLGGDEFVVHCPALRDPQEASDIAANILEALLKPPYRAGTETVHLSASIGVTYATQCDASRLMARADRAMYRAKQRGRARIEVELLT